MPKLIVTTREGETSEIEVENGLTVMEGIRDNGFDDPEFAGKLPEMSEDEDDLLESSDHRSATSRLSCQIPFGAELDGLKVTIAPED